jgi:hypothetical protein
MCMRGYLSMLFPWRERYYQSSSLNTATEYRKIKPLFNAHMGLAIIKDYKFYMDKNYSVCASLS